MKVWKVKEMIGFIESDGWYLVNQKGSHRQYKHHWDCEKYYEAGYN